MPEDDDPAPGETNGSPKQTFAASRSSSGKGGAPSRSLDICDSIASSRSATKPSTATSGQIDEKVEHCIPTSVELKNNDANGTEATIVGDGWPANDTSLLDPPPSKPGNRSDTGKWIPLSDQEDPVC
jgi:hypothetical protein